MHLDILFIYFFYGLGFFTMGLVMALESFREPSLGSSNQLLPLAAFGVLHGLHEWLEIFLMQMTWAGFKYPDWVLTTRLVLLGISFIFLFYFGVKHFRFKKLIKEFQGILSISVLGAYVLFIGFNTYMYILTDGEISYTLTDILIRYLIAVPAAILASNGLFRQSKDFRTQGRTLLAKSIRIVGFGFLIYGITQLVVSELDFFPARFINVIAFSNLFGFPVQLIRAFTAFLVMIGMLKAVSLVDKERQDQLLQAQNARIEAMIQIQDELTEREAMRKEMLRHTVRAQEDERTHIARELHDETSQILSALSLNLGTLRQLSVRRKDITELVDRLQDLGKQMSQGIFRLVHDLRPAQLDVLGLPSALISLTQRENCPPGLNVHLEISGQERRLDSLVETVLFRVAQEAMTNTCRHSRIDDAYVKLDFGEDRVELSIKDEGIGFNPEDNFSPPRGWGLAGMQERVDSVGGTLSIISAPGKGTMIKVVIPSKLHTEDKEKS